MYLMKGGRWALSQALINFYDHGDFGGGGFKLKRKNSSHQLFSRFSATLSILCKKNPTFPTTCSFLSANPIILDASEIVLSVNPFLNKPWFLRVCSTSLLKTLWLHEKLFVISPFPSVF